MATTRFTLMWAATMDYEIIQINIKSTYLYGELNPNETIYIRLPPGEFLKDIRPRQVLKLNKVLYGLKQAG